MSENCKSLVLQDKCHIEIFLSPGTDQNVTDGKMDASYNDKQMSRGMRFPTMWYVRPAKAQTSLRICAV